MSDHRRIPAVHMVDSTAYERLCASDAIVDELFHMASPVSDAQTLTAVGLDLRRHLDPARVDEPGHVAWALGKTLPMLVRLASQDAVKRSEKRF